MQNIHRAIQMHCMEDVNVFMKTCTSKTVNQKDEEGQTVLHVAAAENMVDLLLFLIKKKAKIDAKDNKGWTPLHTASRFHSFECAEKLIEAKANLHAVSDTGTNVLAYLVTGSENSPIRMKLLEKILPKGINKENEHKETPFTRSCMLGTESVVKLLLKYEPNINQTTERGETALHLAVHRKCPNTVRLLLDENIDINARTSFGYTAAEEARELGEISIAAMIESKLDTPLSMGNLVNELKLSLAKGDVAVRRGGSVRKTSKSHRMANSNVTVTSSVTDKSPQKLRNLRRSNSLKVLKDSPIRRTTTSQDPQDKTIAAIISPRKGEMIKRSPAAVSNAENPPTKKLPMKLTPNRIVTGPIIPAGQRNKLSARNSKELTSNGSSPVGSIKGNTRATTITEGSPNKPPERPPRKAPPVAPRRKLPVVTDTVTIDDTSKSIDSDRVTIANETKSENATESVAVAPITLVQGANTVNTVPPHKPPRSVSRRGPPVPNRKVSQVQRQKAYRRSRSLSPNRKLSVNDLPETSPLSKTLDGATPSPAASALPEAKIASSDLLAITVNLGSDTLHTEQKKDKLEDIHDIKPTEAAQDNETSQIPNSRSHLSLSHTPEEIYGSIRSSASADEELIDLMDQPRNAMLTMSRRRPDRKRNEDGSIAVITSTDVFKKQNVARDNLEKMLTRRQSCELVIKKLENAQLPVKGSITIPQEVTMEPPPDDIDPEMISVWKTFEELLYTENQYVRQMGTLILVYKRPLELDSSILSTEECDKIFCNVEELFKLSSKILQMLVTEKRKPLHQRDVGKIFNKYIPEFKLFNEYCTNQVFSTAALENFRTNRKRFREFIEYAKEQEGSNFEDISGFLIKPFQRVCRYVLLLKELAKQMGDTSQHIASIQEAIEGIDEIVRQANETKRVMDNEIKMQNIRMHIDIKLDPELAVKFICEGDFKEWDHGQMRKRHFFLFNKLLVITKKGPRGKHFAKRIVNVENCLVWDKNDLPDLHAFQLVRTDSTEKIIFVCPTPGLKENWMAQINSTISVNELFW